MITYNGKTYILKYNQQRIEMIEAATDMPVMAELRKTGGMLGLSTLKTYFSYGLKEDGADVFVPLKTGRQIADSLIEENGYADVITVVLEALERDCPFFFRGN